MGYEAALADYTTFDFTHDGRTYPVYRRGSGPAVIIMHEMPGLHPLVIRFADRVVAAGMTVFCPSLFGTPGKPVSKGYALTTALGVICIRREFYVWRGDRSSPVVDWLKALSRQAHAECGGKGVGAVGMCFTGGFALAMMTDPSVVAPALSQPSLPLARGNPKRAAAIGVSPKELACVKARLVDEDLTVMGLRFTSDELVPDARFDTYRRELGDRFEAIELSDEDARPAFIPPHSVLTLHLKEEGPTKAAEQRVIQFFKARTGA
ncbi:MAG: dienelactone hydrolase family protein [Alphaproteobacteria bacterium]|nr:dienelactone hydrolase family protein [Alphaproteobacteria bacterium]MBU1514259.1 dienelactone hydrolase family protein [Alphaproteobacteria bacterium]MBU2093295.1 dienelactone hydrolase family protein [Alphaproteobacteria bacterium]MBU2309030.1 dienelactone hydrolase family protein [Alphaproteobacteria bacterium]MBU2365208.1 dienelactone hydrolase family protein [Alphaproteobacteria bacterium]